MSVAEQLPQPCEKASRNPWLLVCGTSFGLIVLVAMCMLLLAFFAPPRKLRDNERQLPDGSVLRIEGVTFGTTHRLKFEPESSAPWAFWKQRPTPIQYGTGKTELIVWMTRRDARTGRSLDFDWWAHSTAVDVLGADVLDYDAVLWEMRQGNRRANGHERPFRTDQGSFDTWLAQSSFPAFRTEQNRFKLQVFNTAGKIVATFDLTHPSPLSAGYWNAEELPATKSNGELAMTLHRLHPRLHKQTINGVERKSWYYWPETTLTENGMPTNQWNAEPFELTDPVGNPWYTPYHNRHFSTREPAWMLRMRAFRPANANFSTAEIWKFVDQPLPAQDKVELRNDEISIADVDLILIALAGAGNTTYALARSPGQGVYSFNSRTWDCDTNTSIEIDEVSSAATVKVESHWPHLVMGTSGETPLHRLYVLAKDDQGRNVPTQVANSHNMLTYYFFKTEPDAKSLTFSIIVHRGHEFEFFVKPPDLVEDKPMP